jgi:hypothetical protein
MPAAASAAGMLRFGADKNIVSALHNILAAMR